MDPVPVVDSSLRQRVYRGLLGIVDASVEIGWHHQWQNIRHSEEAPVCCVPNSLAISGETPHFSQLVESLIRREPDVWRRMRACQMFFELFSELSQREIPKPTDPIRTGKLFEISNRVFRPQESLDGAFATDTASGWKHPVRSMENSYRT